MSNYIHISEDSRRDRIRRIEEHTRRISSEESRQSVEDLRDSLIGFLRRLDVNEVGELDVAVGSERKLLDALLKLYDSHGDRLSQPPLSIRPRRSSRPIDAVEVEILLDRHRIEDADLEDDSLIPLSTLFPRRTLQASVRRKQAVRPDTVSNLCAAINAVLNARGIDVAVAEVDILPVPVSLSKLQQIISRSSYVDAAAVLEAANERIPGQLEVVRRRDTVNIRTPELSADLFKETETISLMHFQLRALLSALNISCESLLSYPSSKQPEAAVRWMRTVGMDALIDRIYAAYQRRDSGFRIDPSVPGENNPTQPYATAQCVVGLLLAGHAEKWPTELTGALRFLAGSRRDYQFSQSVVRGWRYFVHNSAELDYPIADIACWVIVAEAVALRKRLWQIKDSQTLALARLSEYVEELLKQQSASGGFVPIPQVEDRFCRTYTTCMAIWALAEAVWATSGSESIQKEWITALNGGIGWLLDHHRTDAGFIPDPSIPKAGLLPGLHAQCVCILSLVERLRVAGVFQNNVDPVTDSDKYLTAKQLLTDWFSSTRRHIEDHNVTIDRLSHFHPTPYRLENTRHLWAPWTMAAFHHMNALGVEGTKSLRNQVLVCFQDFWLRGGEEGFGCNGTYELAESLYCFSHLLEESI